MLSVPHFSSSLIECRDRIHAQADNPALVVVVDYRTPTVNDEIDIDDSEVRDELDVGRE